MELKILKNKAVKNAGWLILGKVMQMAINFFVVLLTARYLGPSNYGLIGYANAYITFFMAFCTLGINSVLVKEFIENPDKEGEILGSSLFMRAISSVFSAIVIIGIVSVIDAGEKTTITVVALCSIGLVFNIFEVFSYWFQSRLQSKVTAIATLLAYLITAVYKFFLLATSKGILWFAFATSVDYICLAIFYVSAYAKNSAGKLKFSVDCSKRVLRQSHHFIFASVMAAIYSQTDKLMLKQMLGTEEVGYYSAAVSISSMWCFVLGAIIDSVYPSIMEINGKDEEIFKKRNRQLYSIVFYISLFVSVLFMVFSPLIVRIIYGEAYISSVNPLRIVTWYTAFSYLGVARNAWIVCKEKQKYLKYIYALAALINVILNVLLIPVWGASGAALASLISQILTSIVLPLFIKPLRENSILMLEAIALKGIKLRK